MIQPQGMFGEGTLCVAEIGSTAEIVRQRLEPVTEVTGKGVAPVQPVEPALLEAVRGCGRFVRVTQLRILQLTF